LNHPTLKGQFRRVRYTDDGCHRYQCLWCLQSIEIRDDPQYGWNFCPLCGKSWFKRLECRDHDTPHWAWERFGPEEHEHPPYYVYKQDRYRIVIEERTKWHEKDWGEWHFETKHRVNFGKLGVWRDMQYYLNRLRARAAPDPDGCGMGILCEYRARLDKLK
jgi:hypothetical protein